MDMKWVLIDFWKALKIKQTNNPKNAIMHCLNSANPFTDNSIVSWVLSMLWKMNKLEYLDTTKKQLSSIGQNNRDFGVRSSTEFKKFSWYIIYQHIRVIVEVQSLQKETTNKSFLQFTKEEIYQKISMLEG